MTSVSVMTLTTCCFGIGTRVSGTRSALRARLQRAERRLDRVLDLRRVDVADHDDRHAFRPIPGVVVGAQPRHRRGADDLGLADRQPLGVARLRVEDRNLLVADSRSRAEAAAPLFDHHAALLLDLGRIQREPAGKVGERGQSVRDDRRLVARQVEHVDRLVEARVGVDVRSETGANRLERRHQRARLEMRAAVERHVLDEVREPLLVVGLLDRAGLDHQPQRHPFLGPPVLPDEVLQPVRQRRLVGRAIEGDLIPRIEARRRGAGDCVETTAGANASAASTAARHAARVNCRCIGQLYLKGRSGR